VPRVLVVEDYPPLAKVIAIALRRSGHDAERVGSVGRALASPGDFDLTVLDLDLPDGDGVALAVQLLERGRTRACVFYTASRDVELRERARRHGEVVDKQAGIDRLLDAVANAVSPRLARAVGAEDFSAESDSSRSGFRPRVKPE
jgi:DNA-binding response OmpR family regulator